MRGEACHRYGEKRNAHRIVVEKPVADKQYGKD
jgi:hypothetical protein